MSGLAFEAVISKNILYREINIGLQAEAVSVKCCYYHEAADLVHEILFELPRVHLLCELSSIASKWFSPQDLEYLLKAFSLFYS